MIADLLEQKQQIVAHIDFVRSDGKPLPQIKSLKEVGSTLQDTSHAPNNNFSGLQGGCNNSSTAKLSGKFGIDNRSKDVNDTSNPNNNQDDLQNVEEIIDSI